MNLNCTLCGRLFSVFGYLIVSHLKPNQGRNTVDAFVNTKNKSRADSYETFISHWMFSFGYIKKKKWQFGFAFSFSPTLGAGFLFISKLNHPQWLKETEVSPWLLSKQGESSNSLQSTSCSGSEELTRGEEVKIPHSAWCHRFHLHHKCRLYFFVWVWCSGNRKSTNPPNWNNYIGCLFHRTPMVAGVPDLGRHGYKYLICRLHQDQCIFLHSIVMVMVNETSWPTEESSLCFRASQCAAPVAYQP